jgi:3-deoxy-7-phosphoheptulonate synthase
MQETIDVPRYTSERPLIKPNELLHLLPLTNIAATEINKWRRAIKNIMQGKDARLLLIAGPCSIHDDHAALEYADAFQKAAREFENEIFMVMRVYFDKPRTAVGWKGMISDPHLDGSYDINFGLQKARKLLLALTAMQIPAATEFLDTLVPQYLSDLVSWGAIGARTAESQLHRELASGLAMPIGFKNSTAGNIQVAIDAVKVARHAQQFLGISRAGEPTIIATRGNEFSHIVLRGGHDGPNYFREVVQGATLALQHAHLPARLVIDCSHGNSGKDYLQQKAVLADVLHQLTHDRDIFGVMLESNLLAGKQILKPNKPLVYGQSITDGCISWPETYELLEQVAGTLRNINSYQLR